MPINRLNEKRTRPAPLVVLFQEDMYRLHVVVACRKRNCVHNHIFATYGIGLYAEVGLTKYSFITALMVGQVNTKRRWG